MYFGVTGSEGSRPRTPGVVGPRGTQLGAWAVLALMVLLSTACAADGGEAGSDGAVLAPTGQVPGDAGDPGSSVTEIEVIDGDTFKAVLDGGDPGRVRLIGIDAPEDGECFADHARRRLEELLASGVESVEADVSRADRYGRRLLYVHVAEGMVNEILAREGVVIAREYPPDTAHAGRLDRAADAARQAGAGLWAADACGPNLAADAADLVIAHVQFDAPGDDGQHLNGEWVEIANRGDDDVELEGWTLRDESASHRYSFPPGLVLAAGSSVRVFSGCGEDGEHELYWCKTGSAIWNNGGDTAFLRDPAGNIVTTWAYSSPGAPVSGMRVR